MVVHDLKAFDGRIAAFRGDEGSSGYLKVHVADTRWSDGTESTCVDMKVVRKPSGSETWEYSERSDPDDADAREELSRGSVDWYGEQFHLSWLDAAAATTVEQEFFS